MFFIHSCEMLACSLGVCLSNSMLSTIVKLKFHSTLSQRKAGIESENGSQQSMRSREGEKARVIRK